MVGSWSSELTKLAALALVVALSPITVIPAVLVLHAPRPRPSGLAFLGGWLTGLAATTALFGAASGVVGGVPKSPPTWASILRIVFGSAFVGFGVYKWLTRHHHTESPRWMRRFSELTPVRAGAMGVVLAVVRPEVLIVCALAGLAIGTSGLGITGDWTAGAYFVGIAASTVVIPVVAYAVAGDRLDGLLTRIKSWMEQNSAALIAVVLIVIGFMVVYNGVSALW